MNYSEALDYLYSRLPMFQRQGKSAYKADLTNTIDLLNSIGNPQYDFKSIHIAGTNGKGTSAHSIAAILQLSGYKVGLYTSPHLKEFTERIKINGKEIHKEDVVQFVQGTRDVIEKINPSFFEVTVAMAFQYFADQKVDIAVIETGLGGRLDSTNVIYPEVSLITNIGLDHTDLLGDTIEKIAMEKAGIIKPEVPVVLGCDMIPEARVVMKDVASKINSEIIEPQCGNESVSAIPYFKNNEPGVREVVGVMMKKGWQISAESIEVGLANFSELTGLKGRYQIIQGSPLVIADVSHNAEGLMVLLEKVKSLKNNELKIIFGSVIDKHLVPIFKVLPSDATYFFTQSSVPRSLRVDDLLQQAVGFGFTGQVFTNVNEAKEAALMRAVPDDIILITGSTFVVAELNEL